MQVQESSRDRQVRVALAIGVVVLTLTTSVIHYTLGGSSTLMGLLFFGNAAAYAGLAAAFVAPIALAERFRWLTRLAIIGVAFGSIGGWVLFGARYDIAYLTKGIELALVALLLVDAYRVHGSPADIAERILVQLRARRQPAEA